MRQSSHPRHQGERGSQRQIGEPDLPSTFYTVDDSAIHFAGQESSPRCMELIGQDTDCRGGRWE